MKLISQMLRLIRCVKHIGMTPGIVSSHLQLKQSYTGDHKKNTNAMSTYIIKVFLTGLVIWLINSSQSQVTNLTLKRVYLVCPGVCYHMVLYWVGSRETAAFPKFLDHWIEKWKIPIVSSWILEDLSWVFLIPDLLEHLTRTSKGLCPGTFWLTKIRHGSFSF